MNTPTPRWLQEAPSLHVYTSSCCGFRHDRSNSFFPPACGLCGNAVTGHQSFENQKREVAVSPPLSLAERHKILPRPLHSLLYAGTGSWLVGGAAHPNKPFPPKDYDILVPYNNWVLVSSMLTNIGKIVDLTRFGGIRLQITTGEMLDIWPGTLEEFFLNVPATHAWHPKSMVLLVKQ